MDKGFKERKKTRKPGCLEIVTVCSIHFIDGIPTAANPVPTLHLGYEKEVPKSRRELFRQPLQKKRKTEKNQQILTDTKENCSNDEINIDCGCENTSSIIATEHSYCKLESANVCLTCVDKSNLIELIVKKTDTLSLTAKNRNVISF